MITAKERAEQIWRIIWAADGPPCHYRCRPPWEGTFTIWTTDVDRGEGGAMTYLEWEDWVMEGGFPDNMLADIERFLTEVHPRLEPGRDIYPEVFETDLFFPLQRQAELAAMIRIARTVEPRTVMEIGADKGGGLYHWCQCLLTVQAVVACEIRGLPYNHLMQAAFPDLKMLWLPCSSRSAAAEDAVRQFLGAALDGCGLCQIDVLFIDGDKGAFLQDFDAYLPLMSPSGVVFMHDVSEPGSLMRRAFETVRTRGYRAEEIVDKSDWYRAESRELRGVPAANPHEAWLRHWRGRSCGVGVIFLEGKR